MTLDFPANDQRTHAQRGVLRLSALEYHRRGMLATDQFHQRQQIDRVERVRHDHAARRPLAGGLQIARLDAGGRGADHHFRLGQRVELAQHVVLERQPLGHVFLDQLGALHRGFQRVDEGQRLRIGVIGKPESLE